MQKVEAVLLIASLCFIPVLIPMPPIYQQKEDDIPVRPKPHKQVKIVLDDEAAESDAEDELTEAGKEDNEEEDTKVPD